jgi:hypothetical protein
MVQFDENHKPTICGIHVRWLDEITIKARTENQACRIAEKLLNEKYPEYDRMVQIF